MGSIATRQISLQLLTELSSAVYCPPGYVVFARDRQLMASPFDLAALRITGEPIALGEAVATEGSFYSAAVSSAANGSLAIRQPPVPAVSRFATFEAELSLLNRDGIVVSRFGGVQRFSRSDGTVSRRASGRRRDSGCPHQRRGTLAHSTSTSGARAPLTSMRSSGGWTGAPRMVT